MAAKTTYYGKNKEESTTLSYDGYELQWEDQFDGASLNRQDWNVELHEPGWVNNELQEYVDSTENIYIQDGSLVLRPVEKRNEDGTVSYTSGRVNTQNKHDFKYGLFEARAKVPKGRGFLPAFWMMPASENLYGQWPRCGEIDIMEIPGNRIDTFFGTLHFGNPHHESQGSYTLDEGDFSEDYHVFAAEWEPGKIRWYVDGKLVHTENDWYSATIGQGEITYPAPFDQPFYIILNLAVGGGWPGNPDETTDIANSAYYIDYVRVYQKNEYDENVKKPVRTDETAITEKEKGMLADGNYVYNGSFQEGEGRLGYWNIQGNGRAEVNVTNVNNIRRLRVNAPEGITAKNPVVISQDALALTEGKTYALRFTAEGDAGNRISVKVAEQIFDAELTGEERKYRYKFIPGEKTADTDIAFYITEPGVFYIDHVRIADYSLIENGSFHAGFTGYEVYVDSTAAASYVVDSLTEAGAAAFSIDDTGDEAWKITIKQNDIELEKDQWYELSLDAKSSIARKIMLEIQGDETPYLGKKVVELGPDYATYKMIFQMKREMDPKAVLRISMGAIDHDRIAKSHRVCIDRIRLEKTTDME